MTTAPNLPKGAKHYRVVVVDSPSMGSDPSRITADVVTNGPPAAAREEASKLAGPLAPGHYRDFVVHVYRSAP